MKAHRNKGRMRNKAIKLMSNQGVVTSESLYHRDFMTISFRFYYGNESAQTFSAIVSLSLGLNVYNTF